MSAMNLAAVKVYNIPYFTVVDVCFPYPHTVSVPPFFMKRVCSSLKDVVKIRKASETVCYKEEIGVGTRVIAILDTLDTNQIDFITNYMKHELMNLN